MAALSAIAGFLHRVTEASAANSVLKAAAPIDGPPDVRARWLTLVLPGLTTRDRTACS
ncbi:MAG: hypothetical protein JST91_11670 [Actinobacteria bacterium]|nr:hypothetical protein [Actinomycetota bacterium]